MHVLRVIIWFSYYFACALYVIIHILINRLPLHLINLAQHNCKSEKITCLPSSYQGKRNSHAGCMNFRVIKVKVIRTQATWISLTLLKNNRQGSKIVFLLCICSFLITKLLSEMCQKATGIWFRSAHLLPYSVIEKIICVICRQSVKIALNKS